MPAMASRLFHSRLLWLLVSSLLFLSNTAVIDARKEGKLSREDDKVKSGIREVYKRALYEFPRCAARDTQDLCCSTAMKSIQRGTDLKLCDLYERFVFTRGLIFLCDRPTIVQECPSLLVKQPRRTDKIRDS